MVINYYENQNSIKFMYRIAIFKESHGLAPMPAGNDLTQAMLSTINWSRNAHKPKTRQG